MSADLGYSRNRSREQAVKLLTHYIQVAWTRAGLKWDSDNEAEIREAVESIIDAASNQGSAP